MQQYIDNSLPADPATLTAHAASIGAILAVFIGWLPTIIVLVPAIYYIILIFESKTVQQWVRHRRANKRMRRVAKLRAKARVLDAKIDAAHKVQVDKVSAAAKVEDAVTDAAHLLRIENTTAEVKAVTPPPKPTTTP